MTHLEHIRLTQQAYELRCLALRLVPNGVDLVALALVHASEGRPLAAARAAAAGSLNITVGVGCEHIGRWVQQALDRAADRRAR